MSQDSVSKMVEEFLAKGNKITKCRSKNLGSKQKRKNGQGNENLDSFVVNSKY